MTSNAGCWKRRLAVLAITTSLLNGCGTVRSEHGRLATCPPVVEYGREFQARAADELNLLPEGSAIVEMLADYSVMPMDQNAIEQLEELGFVVRHRDGTSSSI